MLVPRAFLDYHIHMNKLGKFLLIAFTLLAFRISYSLVSNYIFPVYVLNSDEYIYNSSAYISKRHPTYKISEIWGKGESLDIVNVVISGYSDDSTFITPPLYPASLSFFYKLIPFLDIDGIYILGAILSSLFLGLALFYLDKIFDILWFNDEKRFMVYALLMFFPGSFFFSLVYAESLFLLVSVLFLLNLFKKRYLWSSLFLGLSILTRFYGVVLVLPFIMYIFLAERHNKKFSMTSKLITYLMVAAVPFAVFCWYLFSTTGSISSIFGHGEYMFMPLPFAYFFSLFTKTQPQFLMAHILNAIFLVISLVLVIFTFIKFYFVYEGRSPEQSTLFVYVLVYVLGISSLAVGAPIFRPLSVCLPLFILPAMFYEKPFKNGYLFGALFVLLSLQAMFFSLFLSGIPAYVY